MEGNLRKNGIADPIFWNGSVFDRSTVRSACDIYSHKLDERIKLEGHARSLSRVDQVINGSKSEFKSQIATKSDNYLIRDCYKFLSEIRRFSRPMDSILWKNPLNIKGRDRIEMILKEAVLKKSQQFMSVYPRVLGECSDDSALSILEECFNNPNTMVSAIDGVRNIASPVAIESLRKLLKLSNPMHLTRVAQSLSLLGDSKTVQIYKEIIDRCLIDDHFSNIFSAVYSAKIVCAANDESGFNFLKKLAHSINENVRAIALAEMCELEDPRFLPVANNLLNDENSLVRAMAVQYLSRFDDDWLSKLEKMLKDKSPDVREAAVEGFQYRKEANSVYCLSGIINDKSYNVRIAAIHALAAIADESAIEIIYQAMKDKEMSVRYMAKRTLELLGVADSRTILMNEIRCQGPIIISPCEAIKSLGENAASDCIPEFFRFLKEHDGLDSFLVKPEAIKSIAKLGNADLIPSIEVYLYDSCEEVTKAAIHGLIMLGAEELFQDYLHSNVFLKSLIGAIGLVGTGLVRSVCYFLEPSEFSNIQKKWVDESEEIIFNENY